MDRKIDYEAVVFDMDGVLLDTEKLVLRAWQEVAEKHHIPDIEIPCKMCLGLNQKAAREKFCEFYGVDFPYDEYKSETRELFFGPYYGEHLPVKPGVESILRYLKSCGKKIAVASSTRRELVVKELTDAKLIEYFDILVCGDMVTHSKPHPEIFLTACEELKVKPEKAFAIEDSFNGIRSAHAGKLMPIMVPDMVEPTDEIRALCTCVFPDMGAVLNFLQEL